MITRGARSRPTILIASSSEDVHAREVLESLHERGACARLLDLASIPTRVSLTSRYTRVRDGDGGPRTELRLTDGAAVDLTALTAVWWRRPRPYRVSAEIDDGTMRRFAESETTTALTGLWQSTTCLWVNHLVTDAAAAHKPWQLSTAQAVGLPIPETLITNDVEEARAFWDAHPENVVYKPFRQRQDAWRETRVLLADDLSALDCVRLAPVLFQELIPGAADLRVTVIGHELFAAAAALDDAPYPVDVRYNPGIEYRPHRLPDQVGDGVLRLVRSLELEYAAVDMRLTPEGEYVFLEVNPSGQFLYVERSTGQPITAALAAHLASGAPSR